WESYSALASAYRQAGRPDEAISVLDEAEKQPALAQQVLQMRLEWVRHTATLDELIALQQKAIELAEKDIDPNMGSPYGNSRGGGDPSAEAREALGEL